MLQKDIRESNVELLRLVVMAFIVLHHFIFHGLGIYRFLVFREPSILPPTHIDLALVIDSFFIAAVNVFLLISGYFSIKFKARGIVKLFSIVSFFAMIGFIFHLYVDGLTGGVIGSVVRVIQRGVFVFSNKTFWFVQNYFILMLLSNPINKFIEISSAKKLRITIITLLFINVYMGWIRDVTFVTDGYNLTNFIMLYLIGRYIRLYYHKNIAKKYDVFLFLCSSLMTAILAFVFQHNGFNSFRALCYNSPFVLISSIALFMLFIKIRLKSKIINYLAASCLSIYLLQDGGINCYKQIHKLYEYNGFSLIFWLWISFLFMLSMIIPLFIDKVRLIIFSNIEEKVSYYIDKYVFSKYLE